MEKSTRIKWLDFAKGFTIFLVVLAHTIGVIHSIHFSQILKFLQYLLFTAVMPIFFAISGYLYKPTQNMHEFIIMLYKKISSFLIPYFIFTVFLISLQNIRNIYRIFSRNLIRIIEVPSGYLWYIYALFFIFILVGLMDLMHIRNSIKLFIFIIMLIIETFLPWKEHFSDNINPLAGSMNPVSIILAYAICFYLGFLLNNRAIIKLLRNRCLIISIDLLWICILIAQYLYTGSDYNTNVFNMSNIITKLMSIPVLFSIFINFHQNNCFFKYFDKYGRYTLIIYLIHLPIALVIPRIFLRLHLFYNYSLIIFVLTFSICWFLSIAACYVATRIKIVNFIFYPRKFINNVIAKTYFGRLLK